MKKYVFTLLMISASIGVDAQYNLDSLYGVWLNQSMPDSNRVRAYNNYIFDGFMFSNPDTVAFMATELHKYADEQSFPEAAARGHMLEGVAHYVLANFKQALASYQLSLEIFERVGDSEDLEDVMLNMSLIYSLEGSYGLALEYNDKCFELARDRGDKSRMASALLNSGIIYLEQGNITRALEYLQNSLKLEEEIGDKEGIARALNNIGNVYHTLGDNTKALDYYERTLALRKQLGEKMGIADALMSIGNIYTDERSLAYYEESIALYKEVGNRHRVAAGMMNLGHIHYNKANYTLALEYYSKGLLIMEELEIRKDLPKNLEFIGTTHLKLKNNNLALKYCQRSLNLAKEVGELREQKDAYDCLYQTYKAMGMPVKALDAYVQMIAVRDSMFNEENTKQLTRLEMQYEFDKKEAVVQAEQEKKDALATKELERQKLLRNGFIGGFSIVLLFAGVFFRQRNKISREKQRSEELLLNILPEEVADELKENGSAEARYFDEITVLFTDFKGFTSLSEKVTPKELVADLHACFSKFDMICAKYNIEKIKTIGDAYMAAGGIPTLNKTHAADVAKAALEMVDVVNEGKAQKIQEGLPFFEIRIGIHTGPVVAGIVGVKKFQYDIWGDTVNTASRMESSGEVGRVNISHSTYELLKNDPQFTFEGRGMVAAKGKGTIEMWFLQKHGI